MKIFSVLIVGAVVAAAYLSIYGTGENALDAKFNEFLAQYGRNYASEEEFNFRKSLFSDSLRIIDEHNSKGKSWTLGVNEFADWTKEEYKKMLGYKPKTSNANKNVNFNDIVTNCKDLPLESIDWNGPGYVTPVQNQGSCGSCWAFSAVGALEGAYAKHFGNLLKFSESQLVECDKYSHGCNGGLMENAFIHWMRTAPILESDYPYRLPAGECQEKNVDSAIPEIKYGYRVDVTWQCLYEGLTHGVTSVAIRAENDEFRLYKKGVIDDDSCGTDLDHGVTLTAYDAGTDAWKIKNSWGPKWGEQGYVRIKRDEGMGICGINQENSQVVYDDSEY